MSEPETPAAGERSVGNGFWHLTLMRARSRDMFGTFMTGVTIVTMRDQDGVKRGFTANSFTSVSLHPPLILVCVGNLAGSHDALCRAERFGVNILGDWQREASRPPFLAEEAGVLTRSRPGLPRQGGRPSSSVRWRRSTARASRSSRRETTASSSAGVLGFQPFRWAAVRPLRRQLHRLRTWR